YGGARAGQSSLHDVPPLNLLVRDAQNDPARWIRKVLAHANLLTFHVLSVILTFLIAYNKIFHMTATIYPLPHERSAQRRNDLGPTWLAPIRGIFSRQRRENPMLSTDKVASDWASFTFDKEMVLNAIPKGMRTSAIHISVTPTPAD